MSTSISSIDDGTGIDKILTVLSPNPCSSDGCPFTRQARGQKTIFWKDLASKLSNQYKMEFEHVKVARKWSTLEEGYKKVLDNNNSTGRGVMKFQFYEEMDQLIGDRHDVDYPVIGTAKVVTVRRPEAIFKGRSQVGFELKI